MSKPKAPKAPDPQETAAAQTGQSVGTAIANTVMGQVNEVTPDGSLTYDQTGTYSWTDPNSGRVYNLPQYTATTTLSEDAQALRDANNRGNLSMANLGADQADRLSEILGESFDPSSLSPRADRSGMAPVEYGASVNAPTMMGDTRALPQGVGLATGYENDFGGQRQEVIDGLMGQLNEQRGRDMEALRSQLSNQGVVEGSEAYSRALQDFDRSYNDQRLSAIMAGGQEQSRLVGMARDEAAFGNQANQQMFSNDVGLFGMGSDQLAYNNNIAQQDFVNRQAIQARDDGIKNANFNEARILADDRDRARANELDEAYALRSQPINEITALLSGSQVSTPQFAIAQPYAMPTTDIAGITQQGFQNQMAAYQQQSQNFNSMVGAVAGLGGAAMGGGLFGMGG